MELRQSVLGGEVARLVSVAANTLLNREILPGGTEIIATKTVLIIF